MKGLINEFNLIKKRINESNKLSKKQKKKFINITKLKYKYLIRKRLLKKAQKFNEGGGCGC